VGSRRRGLRHDDDGLISVVVPEQPPVLTPGAAAALLALLLNVQRSDGDPQLLGGSATAPLDHGQDRGAA
jgi:hypothetical protein